MKLKFILFYQNIFIFVWDIFSIFLKSAVEGTSPFQQSWNQFKTDLTFNVKKVKTKPVLLGLIKRDKFLGDTFLRVQRPA